MKIYIVGLIQNHFGHDFFTPWNSEYFTVEADAVKAVEDLKKEQGLTKNFTYKTLNPVLNSSDNLEPQMIGGKIVYVDSKIINDEYLFPKKDRTLNNNFSLGDK